MMKQLELMLETVQLNFVYAWSTLHAPHTIHFRVPVYSRYACNCMFIIKRFEKLFTHKELHHGIGSDSDFRHVSIPAECTHVFVQHQRHEVAVNFDK
jgi:hypothetical protein